MSRESLNTIFSQYEWLEVDNEEIIKKTLVLNFHLSLGDKFFYL